jgi:hypothetical protein
MRENASYEATIRSEDDTINKVSLSFSLYYTILVQIACRKRYNSPGFCYNADVPPDTIPSDYQAFLQSIKPRVQQAQLKAVVAPKEKLQWKI